MSVKLRLLRKGRKRNPFYYIVAADSRAPRDGRFIERVGDYNPNTNPATINLNLDLSVKWLQDGAQPTETVRAILSYKGAMHKDHLLRGAAKGAFPIEEVETRFENWMSEKENRIQEKRNTLAEANASAAKVRQERESKVREAREKAIMAKNSPLAEEVAESEVAPSSEFAPTDEVAVEETLSEEVTATEETPVVEEAPEVEAAAEVEETPVVEEAPVAEVETPVEETPAEETPAEESEEKAAE